MADHIPLICRIGELWAQEPRAALATVIKTRGSAPRPVGSQMYIPHEGPIIGSVSGGCIEGAVITQAQEIMQGAPDRAMEFSITEKDAWNVGLACGGDITVFIENMTEDKVRHLENLGQKHAARETAIRIIDLETGKDIRDAGISSKNCHIDEDKNWFIQPFLAPLRLIIIGAVHIAQPLSLMARTAGYDVTLIDPRTVFARPERFPDFPVLHDWPDEGLEKLGPDARTAVVTLTHDAKLDDPALGHALKSPAFYIAALGGRKTHAARLIRLDGQGDLDRINGPAGLNIHAKSPAEIAISILAQMTEKLHRDD